MAVRNVTVVTREDGAKVATWADVDNGDTGAPILVGNAQHVSIQRTSGAGTVTMEGSNDGTLFGALGAGVVADGTIKAIAERPLFLRPNVTVSSDNVVVAVITTLPR